MSELDVDALRKWLRHNIDQVPDGSISVETISGGHSNLTYGVRIGDRELVVRRPPVGAFLPSANDMSREYRCYAALRDTAVPVPTALALCTDESVIGAPFYVMERLHGVVPHEPSALHDMSPAQRRTLSERFVDVLATLHAVDPDAVGLGDLGRPSGYLTRQVRRWTDQWHRSKEADVAVIDELANILAGSVPASPPSTIVHGDYRLGNIMVDTADRSRIVGVFDWEMATLGDPLADVGYTLLYWGAGDGRPVIHSSVACAELPGMLTADELTARYSARTGTPVEHITFYVVLAAFKLTIIFAGHRALRRRAGVDEGPADWSLAEWALRLATGP